jgi:serine/threonine-protein kinase RsbW
MSEIRAERIEVRFPGSSRYLPAVRALVREVIAGDEDGRMNDVSGILLAVHEAFVNAVRHGHHGDAGQAVSLVVEDGPECLEIRVLDQGAGFVMPDALDDDSDLTSEGGRGLGIMRAVMDSVSVEHAGGITTVSLVKNKGRL